MASEEQMLQCELLVVRIQRGDESAFASLVELWERPLFYYLRRVARSEADAWDLLQETWLKVFRAIGTLRESRALPAFLYATARNTAFSRLRERESEERAVAFGHESIDAADDENAAFDNVEEVHNALDRLPLAQREALTLFFLEDLSLDAIAAVLGVPVGTVKSRLHYGKAALRKIFSEGDRHAS